jgi:hypothetical protein
MLTQCVTAWAVRYFNSSTHTLLAIVALAIAPARAAENARSRDYWVAIRASDFAVPEGEQAYPLLLEMNELLGSTDPVLRDEVAYSAAARWVYRQRLLSPEQNRELLALWRASLAVGVGERDTDSVLKRSFSALDLSLLAALDNEAPFMTPEDFDGLLRDALDYLDRERDTRGYDEAKGWMHAAGHTADLLKFMARSPRLTVADQRKLLDAVAAKCVTNGSVFAWGEDERLAQVVRSVVRRADFDNGSFDTWVTAFPKRYEELWAAGPAIEVPRYVAVQNLKSMLRAAHTALAMDAELTPAAQGARTKLLGTLATMR